MFELFESYFWEVATSSISFIVPIISLALIFLLVRDLLWK